MTAIQTLIKAQEALYMGGARNFLLVDVPPMQRSPLGPVRGIYLVTAFDRSH